MFFKRSRAATFDGSLPPPSFAGIQTTYYCNLRCRMCVLYINGTTVSGPHMTFEDFSEVARALFPFVTRWQPSVTGEPTMAKRFDRMLEIASEYGVKADITTNATLFTDKMIDLLLPNIGAVTFSFDGHDAETFEEIREGARFGQVVQNIKALVARARNELSDERQPMFGLSCVAMKRNIHGLAELVELAANELGVDYVVVSHVFPVTEEIKEQSLAHDPDLAKREFDRALGAARKAGIALTIMPLDEITAATARSSESSRELATKDGAVGGLILRSENTETVRGFPELSPALPDYPAVVEKRRSAAKEFSFPARAESRRRPPARRSIWFCDYLWNKTYVKVDKSVLPCCVHGMPTVGRIENGRFDSVWNNDIYRAMRQGLVVKNPVPVCKGCQHIQEITDRDLIDTLLQGKEIPTEEETLPVPDVLCSGTAEG